MQSLRITRNALMSRKVLPCFHSQAPAFLQPSPCSFSVSAEKGSAQRPSEHTDLKSFLDYASRVSLDDKSTVFTGTRYEYVVVESLRRFGLGLERTGGRLDKGIDLMGSWQLPSLPTAHRLRVLVQCKALAKKLGPNHVRELEGAFNGAPASWRIDGNQDNPSNVLGLLIAPKEATKGVRDAMARSRSPMGFAMVQLNGGVAQIFWNKAAAARGLDGVDVSVRHVIGTPSDPSSDISEDLGVREEIALTWNGRIVSAPT